MSPSTSDSSQGKTPKSEPRDSPFPTPTSQSPSRPHRKRTRDESNDDDAGDMSLGGARHNIGRSMLTPSLLKHAQREVAKRMSALSAGRKSIVSGSAPRHIPEVPPPTGACDANDSVPELTPTSTGAQEADAKPFDPFVDMPAYGKGPRLMFAQLDADQQRVVEVAVKKGKNVCSVGGAGTGKSETCDILLDELRTKGKNVAIVTPSGTAAVNVRAQTLHSFFGLGGQNNKGIDKCKSQMRTTIKERLRNVDTLVIDEISMVSYEMFDRMDQMSRAARGDDIPFGGMQLIAFGDFCQLPPVKPQEHCYRCGRERQKITLQGQRLWQCSTSADHGDIIDGDKMWAFQSEQWDMMNFEYLPLNHVHRQANGPLLALLNKLRHGKPFTYKEERLLLDHPCDVTNAVELVSRLDAAQKINHSRFAQLADSTQDRPFYYHCRDDFDWKRDLHPELSNINQNIWVALSKHPYEEEVRLQSGQPVILQKNLDVQRGLVNGSQGVIQHFIPYDRYQQPRESGSEGSLLSYIRRQRVMSFMRDQGCPSLPVVKFNNLDAPEIVYPDCSILEKGYEAPHSLLIRTQIPLLSGWALTIHKAQGMTLDKAIVDLSHCFASGMSYVALSRVKTLEGLKVHGFKANGIKHEVDDKVKVFLSDKFGESFS